MLFSEKKYSSGKFTVLRDMLSELTNVNHPRPVYVNAKAWHNMILQFRQKTKNKDWLQAWENMDQKLNGLFSTMGTRQLNRQQNAELAQLALQLISIKK